MSPAEIPSLAKSRPTDRGEFDPPRADPKNVLVLIDTVVSNPVVWVGTPCPQLGVRKPIDLIGTDEEAKVVNLLSAVDHGLF